MALLFTVLTIVLACSSTTEANENRVDTPSPYHSHDVEMLQPSPFQIIIDGGSTGSRLHVFEFVHHHDSLECVRRGSWKAWPALSSFGRVPSEIKAGKRISPQEVAAHLVPVFEQASHVIPLKYHASTFIKYQATAGMRLLDLEEQEAVYDALYAGLQSSFFFSSGIRFSFSSFRRHNVATLGGELEGLYGAIAANYLSGVIDARLNIEHPSSTINATAQFNDQNELHRDHPIIGALDMGGSSAQLVFLPHPSHVTASSSEVQNVQGSGHNTGTCLNADTSNEEPPSSQNKSFDSSNFFSTSYLSYGVDQFRERLWDILVDHHQITTAAEDDPEQQHTCLSNRIANPCSFVGHATEWKGYTLVGQGSAQECMDLVKRLLPSVDRVADHHNGDERVVGGVTHPPIRGKFFAMSLFYFTLDSLRALSSGNQEAHSALNLSWPNPSMEELENALSGLCSRSWHEDLVKIQHEAHEFTRPAVLPHRCIESVYLVTLLRYGFGFDPTSRDITFAYEVNGSEVEWALGMALDLFIRDEEVDYDYDQAFESEKNDDMHDSLVYDQISANNRFCLDTV